MCHCHIGSENNLVTDHTLHNSKWTLLEMKPFWDTPNSVLYWATLTGECKWKFQTAHMWESVPPDQNGLLLLHSVSVHNVIGLVPAAVAPDRRGRRESSIFSLWKLHRKRGLKTSCRMRDLVCKLSWIDSCLVFLALLFSFRWKISSQALSNILDTLIPACKPYISYPNGFYAYP